MNADDFRIAQNNFLKASGLMIAVPVGIWVGCCSVILAASLVYAGGHAFEPITDSFLDLEKKYEQGSWKAIAVKVAKSVCLILNGLACTATSALGGIGAGLVAQCGTFILGTASASLYVITPAAIAVGIVTALFLQTFVFTKTVEYLANQPPKYI